MSMPNVDIRKKAGGGNRQLPGFDHYSGMILYGTAPVVTGKWATYLGPPNIKNQQLFSAVDATNAGVIPYTDNTAASASFIITTPGATGNTVEFVVTFPLPNSTTGTQSLGIYTIDVSQNTIDLQGAALAAVINNGTVNHGFVAVYTAGSDTMTITAPKLYGVSLNSGTPLALTTNGAFAATITQFSLGTASPYALWYYHIKEFFRRMPNGNLRVGIISAPDSFNELKTLQRAAGSKLRQVGIFDISTTRAAANTITGTLLQVDTAAKLMDKTAPMSVVYSPNMKLITDMSTYPDQNLNVANKVQPVISQDGDAEGALLFVRNGMTCGNMGIKLATIALSRVSASDAEVIDLFNNTDGVENNLPAFANGQLASDVSENLQAQLDTYRYTFFRLFGDTVVGTYWSGNRCAVINTSDYANVNDNRTIDKVSRIAYSTLIPKLNSELIFNTDGTMKNYTVEYFQDLVDDAVTINMITGFGSTPLISGVGTYIDPSQPVKQTENLTIEVTIIQNGIARNITVDIGYALSL